MLKKSSSVNAFDITEMMTAQNGECFSSAGKKVLAGEAQRTE
jgi:hypothetical protein